MPTHLFPFFGTSPYRQNFILGKRFCPLSFFCVTQHKFLATNAKETLKFHATIDIYSLLRWDFNMCVPSYFKAGNQRT